LAKLSGNIEVNDIDVKNVVNDKAYNREEKIINRIHNEKIMHNFFSRTHNCHDARIGAMKMTKYAITKPDTSNSNP